MAAPPEKTLKDLNGKWGLNKKLSDSPEPPLLIQGIGWVIRKGIVAGSVTLHVKQWTGPPSPPAESTEPAVHIEIDQTITGGLKGTSEKRCLDWEEREHSDWVFGAVVGQTKWVNPADITDPYLAKDWEEGEAEASGPNGETHIYSYVASQNNGWTARQIWGFQIIEGQRRYARNIVVEKGDKKAEIRLVYDWLG